MKVKEMWNLDEDAVAALKALPETGMGFQLVEGSFWSFGAPKKPGEIGRGAARSEGGSTAPRGAAQVPRRRSRDGH